MPAAGRGERLGGATPKALRLLGGRPLLTWAVDSLAETCEVVVVAGSPEFLPAVRAAALDAIVVPGGHDRSDSVRAALAVLPASVRYVLVHDAARPRASATLAACVLAALEAGAKAVVPVLPVADTVKIVDASGWVMSTPARSSLRLVQTPQGFEREVLEAAHAAAADATDDAGLVEALGIAVFTVPGELQAAKVTTAADLVAMELALVRSADG